MCGIAGVMSLTDRQPDPTLVQRMIDRLAHRGPDDDSCASLGRATIGMRRLSILDPTPRGHQPMSSADGRFTLDGGDAFWRGPQHPDVAAPIVTRERAATAGLIPPRM